MANKRSRRPERRAAVPRRWHRLTSRGTGPLAGDYQGVAQVMAMFGKLRELSGGTIQHGLHDVLASNDHVVVLATLRAQRAGKHLQDNAVHVMQGDGTGKATEVWTSGSDPDAQQRSGRSAQRRDGDGTGSRFTCRARCRC